MTPPLTQCDILVYAIDGAQTKRGLNGGNPDFTAADFRELDDHIDQLKELLAIECKKEGE
jgi:hypothetical protein